MSVKTKSFGKKWVVVSHGNDFFSFKTAVFDSEKKMIEFLSSIYKEMAIEDLGNSDLTDDEVYQWLLEGDAPFEIYESELNPEVLSLPKKKQKK